MGFLVLFCSSLWVRVGVMKRVCSGNEFHSGRGFRLSGNFFSLLANVFG